MLEPVDHSHDVALHAAVEASRPELLTWMPWVPGHTSETQSAYAERAIGAWKAGLEHHFAMVEDGTAVGVVGANPGPESAEVHYWIRSDRAGRGLTSEAASAVVDFAVTVLRCPAVVLHIGEANVRSRRVAEKLGFGLAGPLVGGMEGGLGSFPAVVYERCPI